MPPGTPIRPHDTHTDVTSIDQVILSFSVASFRLRRERIRGGGEASGNRFLSTVAYFLGPAMEKVSVATFKPVTFTYEKIHIRGGLQERLTR